MTQGSYNIPTPRLLIQILFPLSIITPQSLISHIKMKIICDADLHKFRNNPQEKNGSLFLLKRNSSQTAQSVL
jgi:hypothetical protein